MQTIRRSQKKTVLIIDDDPDVLEILQTCFACEGMDVIVSDGSADILQLIDECQPDAIILDYLLRGVNGGELCHQVKTSPKYSHIPVAIVSAYPRVLQSLGTYGCNLFVAKPFDLEVLICQVKKLTSGHDLDSSLMKQQAPGDKYRIYAR